MIQLTTQKISNIYQLNEGCEKLLVVFHGYGQQAEFFINKFKGIEDFEIWAPEAPNQYYLNGFSGRVGGNWLTKYNRDIGIAWQLQFGEQLINAINDKGFDEVHFLGFSQGVATLSRILNLNLIDFKSAILIAGEIAPEAFQPGNWLKKEVSFLYGDRDEFFSQETVTQYFNNRKELKNIQQPIVFHGKHEVPVLKVKNMLH